jgi:hypothetical protein
MTKNEFLAACLEHDVAPAIALENESIVAALQSRDREEVARILREEF